MYTRNLASGVGFFFLSEGRRRDVSPPFLLELFTGSLLQCKRTLHSFHSAVCRRRSHARRHAVAAALRTGQVAEPEVISPLHGQLPAPLTSSGAARHERARGKWRECPRSAPATAPMEPVWDFTVSSAGMSKQHQGVRDFSLLLCFH